MEIKKLIFLTACVNPNGMGDTAIQDTNVRLRQYVGAANYYIAHTQNKILIVENTGVDLTAYLPRLPERLEVMTFKGNDFDRRRGKGYGEALIMEYASQHSRFYSEADMIVKITGRDIVTNVNGLIREASNPDFVYARYSSHNGHLCCLSRFLVFPRKFLDEKFLPNIDRLDDSKEYFFEDFVFDMARRHIREFFRPVMVRGVSGSTGKPLPRSYSMYLESAFKYFLHKAGFFRMHF